jgi:hypothetical protein
MGATASRAVPTECCVFVVICRQVSIYNIRELFLMREVYRRCGRAVSTHLA